jgi:hypothetical protein
MTTRNVSALTEPLIIGSGDDYSQFDADGSLRHMGAATVWDDVVQSISAVNMYSTPGKVDFDFAEQWAVLQASGSLDTNGDIIFINYQLPHAARAGSLFRLHMHWSQSSATVRTIGGKYRIQDNGTGTTSAWSDFTASTAHTEAGGGSVLDVSGHDFGSGNFNQITRLVDIDLTGLGVSAIVQLRFARTDANAGADIYLYSVDGHVEKDSGGSREEYTK